MVNDSELEPGLFRRHPNFNELLAVAAQAPEAPSWFEPSQDALAALLDDEAKEARFFRWRSHFAINLFKSLEESLAQLPGK